MPAYRVGLTTFAGALLWLALGAASPIDDANNAVLAARAGKYDEAIQLFSTAINSNQLNLSGRSQAYAYRAIAKAAIGDYDGGREDLNFSVALQSDYSADAYAFRGFFELVLDDAQNAAADLAKSAQQKIWAYNVLWLALAREKGHLPDTDNLSLSAHAMRLDLAQWPGPVVKYLMGGAGIEEVNTAAKEGDPMRLNERLCDADFYIAERNLARGQTDAATPLLQHAVQVCPFASFERMGATAELMRLK